MKYILKLTKFSRFFIAFLMIAGGVLGFVLIIKAHPELNGKKTQLAVAPEKATPLVPPRVAEFLPANGAQEVVLDIEDPVRITLDRPAKKFFLKAEFEPAAEVAYVVNDERTEFSLLPKVPFTGGKKYTVNVFLKGLGEADSAYQKIYSSGFETLPDRPAAWEKDFALRLEQAEKYTRAKINEGKYIDINLDSQVMTIFEQGRLLDVYLVSSGKRGMDTPRGTFTIQNKTPRAWSKTYGLFMPSWMAITPGGKYGIHELPEWPGGYKEGASHLGTPVSHGCVRLGVGAAKRVFDWAEVGTTVVIY